MITKDSLIILQSGTELTGALCRVGLKSREVSYLHRVTCADLTPQAVASGLRSLLDGLAAAGLKRPDDVRVCLSAGTMLFRDWAFPFRSRAKVEQALSLRPEHLSCYGLKVEPGTPLDDRVIRGERLPDDDVQADLYLWMVDRLAREGYRQYEVSNFARSGFQSRHNLKYWMGRPYIGFGPGAHSDFGGRRYSFVRDLDRYITGVLEGGAVIDESELIPQRERGGEYLMLRLRTTRGIEEWEYRREYFMNFDPIEQLLEEYERQGWAERHDRRWNLTPKGFLVSNQLIGELMTAQEEATLNNTLPRLRRGRPEQSAPQP